MEESQSHPCRAQPNDFRHAFAAKRQILPSSFENALFFECAPLQALLVGLVFDSSQSKIFSPDYELIGRVAGAKFFEEVVAAISDYWGHPANDGWTRRKVKIRISTRRVRRLAAELLPSRGSVKSAGVL